MIYIGNYSNWIQDEWIAYLLNNEGIPRPKTTSENPDCEEFRIATQAGYDLTKTYWYHYTNTTNTFPLPLEIPIKKDREHVWWFIKMLPGMFMPMHRDPHAVTEKNVCRYWMPLQDYQEGHVFIYNSQLLTNYKKGDLWMYEASQEVHGACNLGYNPRLVFNFSTFDL